MLIRMTLKDNDFTELLETFSNDLIRKLLSFPLSAEKEKEIKEKSNRIDSLNEEDSQELYAFYLKNFNYTTEMNNILNPNLCEKPNQEQEKVVLESVREHFKYYLESCLLEEDTKNCISSSFEVNISHSYEDRWENGEVVYYSSTNNKYLIN